MGFQHGSQAYHLRILSEWLLAIHANFKEGDALAERIDAMPEGAAYEQAWKDAESTFAELDSACIELMRAAMPSVRLSFPKLFGENDDQTG